MNKTVDDLAAQAGRVLGELGYCRTTIRSLYSDVEQGPAGGVLGVVSSGSTWSRNGWSSIGALMARSWIRRPRAGSGVSGLCYR